LSQSLLHIDSAIFASIHDFDWAIRSLAMGEYIGKKKSSKLGSGMEFSQYRPYSQGDDLRQLDWKMYARTDKFYIKQSEVETNVDVTFMIDNSRSMLYEESGLKKLDVAKLLVGVLGFVGLENGDWIGIADGTTMKSGNDKRHWIRFLNSLQKLETVASFTEPYIENRRSKELFVFVSDLYDVNDEMLRFIKSLKSSRNEVIVFHLLGEKEASLDFNGAIRARDLETNQVVQLNAKSYAATYQKQLLEWKSSLAHEFQMAGVDYQFASFNTPVATIINGFLNRRKQLL
jgi:uncharacterized protein (DUF58 family)